MYLYLHPIGVSRASIVFASVDVSFWPHPLRIHPAVCLCRHRFAVCQCRDEMGSARGSFYYAGRRASIETFEGIY